jgi:hypothetical protein
MSKWQEVLGTVAPWIGAAAGGGVPALVGMAASQIGAAFGKDIKPTADAIAAAIGGASPEQMLAIKVADNDFAAKMQELGFSNIQALEQIAANDRNSAREMHKEVRDLSTPILSYMVVLAFFGVIFLVLTKVIPVQAEMRDVVMVLIGTLTASFTQVMNFRFGSSAGSRQKNEIIRKYSAQ